ncbi:MAG: hypothetical protein IJ408_01615 [Clostridia bacterium]|nr:hypothetical protein [Clostridia bacterium]
MAENKNSKNDKAQIDRLLEYILENEEKLRILLSGDPNVSPLVYPIKGKRSTKTVFIAEKLQCLVNEFCIEKELKIGDVIEHALIQYLNQNGYSSKLEPILKNIEVIS